MSTPQRPDAELVVARAVGALALAGVALIHLLDLPGKIKEVPYIGILYLGLIVASMAVAGLLIARDNRRDWLLAGGLAAATVLGYALNRTVGLPMATEDIGNWLEPLGLASLFVEIGLIALAGWAFLRPRDQQGADHWAPEASSRSTGPSRSADRGVSARP